jgi:hypothetical protein
LVEHNTTNVTQKVCRHQIRPVITTGATTMSAIFKARNTAESA